MISNKLADTHATQKQISETQNKNWAIIEQQFQVFGDNIRTFRDCNQMLFSYQPINFNFDTAASLLTLIYADVKSYRSALYAYRLNLLNSIPTLLQMICRSL